MKYIFFVIFSFLSGSPCYSQSWAWAKTALYGGQSSTTDLAIDAWGNLYSIGYFTSSISWGSTVLNSEGGTDVFIVKYNSSGNFVWAKRYGGKGDDEGWGIGTDSLGNVYASGSFQDTVSFGPNSIITKGFDDIFIVKLDSAGNQLWAKSAGGPYPDIRGKLTTNPKGEIFMTGLFADTQGPPYTYGTIDFDAIQLISNGSGDMFLVKYDKDGNVIWARNGGGLRMDLGNKVCLDDSGNIFVCGFFLPPSATLGSITLMNQGDPDAFIVKYDPTGNVLWARAGSGAESDFGSSLVTDRKGNVYLLGIFDSNNIQFGTTQLTSNGQFQIFLVKYNPAGVLVWAKQAGWSSWEDANSITIDGESNIYITGLYMQATIFDNDSLTSQGGEDIYVVKYDSNGNVKWALSAGGGGTDVGTGMAYNAAEGSIVLTGNCSGNASFGSHAVNSTGNNFFLAKLAGVTSVTGPSQNNDDVLVYPNPAKETLHISCGGGYSRLRLLDQSGRVLVNQTVLKDQKDITVNIASLAAGMYWLQLQGEKQTVYKKIIRQ